MKAKQKQENKKKKNSKPKKEIPKSGSQKKTEEGKGAPNPNPKRVKSYLLKLQGLPIKKRKLIFWLTLSGVALVLIILFIYISAQRISSWRSNDFEKQINLPSFDLNHFNEK